MATNLTLDDELNSISAIRGSAKGWVWRSFQLLRKGFLSNLNPFGTAALKNFGIHRDQIPVISGGKLNARHLPNDLTAGDFTGSLIGSNVPTIPGSKLTSGTFDVARLPAVPVSKIISGVFNAARFGSVVRTGVTITDAKLVYNRGNLRTETQDDYDSSNGPYYLQRRTYRYNTYTVQQVNLSNSGVLTVTITLNPVRIETRHYVQTGK